LKNKNFNSCLNLLLNFLGSIAMNLNQVPNQPTVFVADPTQKRRYEDAIIAWTWKTFIENPDDPSILLRLPMTKAAVKAMDTAVEFAAKNGFGNIQKFMVAGESKRGWTTWTTAAVDKRVFAAAPIVMVCLFFYKQIKIYNLFFKMFNFN
jgi:PhoPQ-activated pathogenicity-related protein